MKPFYERYEDFIGMELQNVTIVIDHKGGGSIMKLASRLKICMELI